MKYTILLGLLAFVLGCKPSTTETGNSTAAATAGGQLNPEQQKAVQLAGTSLSGQASGAISADGKALELTISNSAILNDEPDLVLLHGSRAAWIFYKNMGSEKPSFERVEVKVVMDTTFSLPYKLTDLAIVEARMPTVDAASKYLIAGDFDNFYKLFDPKVMGTMQVEGLRGYCTQVEPTYGKPLSFDFRGFSFNKTSGGQDFLSLAGNLKREIKDTPFNISIDLTKPGMEQSLYSFMFDY